ncbi:MAG: polysaccharide deacetylase family protein [Oscillospiraceae bacterium]|nr:polysaccharide deacetylase family protein [Oscillospiraceae bacterium]
MNKFKKRVALLLVLVCAALLTAVWRFAANPENTLYILMYHSIVPDGTPCNDWMRTETQFRGDLQWLADNGYTTVLPSELAAGGPLPERAVLLTLDDGYKDNYTIAYPVLQEFQAKAVIALIASHMDQQNPSWLTWDECAEMLASGLVEFGSHTYSCHDNPYGIKRFDGESREEYEARVFADIDYSIELIESNLDTTVQFFAYPGGNTDRWASAYLRERFDLTVTTTHGRVNLARGLYDMRRCNVSQEEPPSYSLPSK